MAQGNFYVLPNAFDVLIIQVALDVSAVMLSISGLSLLALVLKYLPQSGGQ